MVKEKLNPYFFETIFDGNILILFQKRIAIFVREKISTWNDRLKENFLIISRYFSLLGC